MIIIENYDNSKKELAVLLAESSITGTKTKILSFLIDVISKVIDLAVKAITWITGQLVKGFMMIKDKIRKIAKKYEMEKVRTVTVNKTYKYKTKSIPSLKDFRNMKVTKLDMTSNLNDTEIALEELKEVRIENNNGNSEPVEWEYRFKDSYDFIDNADNFIRDTKKQLEQIIKHLKMVERELINYSKTPEGASDMQGYEEYRATIQALNTLTKTKVKFLDVVKTAGMDHLIATIKAKDEMIESLKYKNGR